MLRSIVFDRLRMLSPYPVRRWVKEQPWFAPISRVVFGNEVYCESYYRDVERLEQTSTGPIAEWIVGRLQPKRLIDVGCGPGHLSAALVAKGVDVFGVDVSHAALLATARKGIKCQRFDLTARDAVLPGGPYDVAMSCEVAEHLEKKHARRFVEHLTSVAAVVYLTAAEPNLTGVGLYHFNEQPNEYWIQLFKERGYEHDTTFTDDARRALGAEQVIAYLRRPLIFRASKTSSDRAA